VLSVVDGDVDGELVDGEVEGDAEGVVPPGRSLVRSVPDSVQPAIVMPASVSAQRPVSTFFIVPSLGVVCARSPGEGAMAVPRSAETGLRDGVRWHRGQRHHGGSGA
jgi:hypothetical protein